MELKDTDYKEDLKAEYYQLTKRLLEFGSLLEERDMDELDFAPETPRELLRTQYEAMLKYKLCLELRAEYEGIKI